MKERPIKYNSEMAQARREGRKTQTRRIINPQPPNNCNIPFFCSNGLGNFLDNPDGDGNCDESFPIYDVMACPYGQPGTIIPVLEVLEDGTLVYDGDDEVVNVRVERLNDISEEDARADGVTAEFFGCMDPEGDKEAYRLAFKELWESIHGKGSWDLNPWVWVIGFRRII